MLAILHLHLIYGLTSKTIWQFYSKINGIIWILKESADNYIIGLKTHNEDYPVNS